jgi:hypothetical protein
VDFKVLGKGGERQGISRALSLLFVVAAAQAAAAKAAKYGK